jgi:uncharacterized membrane protein YqaE (UPF0057 family)
MAKQGPRAGAQGRYFAIMHEGRGLTLRQARQHGNCVLSILLFLLMHAITAFPVLMHALYVNALKSGSSAASKPAFRVGRESRSA